MAEDLDLGIGARVRRRREELELTQQQLASAIDISSSTLALIEQGKVKNPRVATVVALARALKVTVNDLLNPGDG